MGKKKGALDARGLVTLKGLNLVLEQVSAIVQARHKKLWSFLQKILRMLDYDVKYAVLSPKQIAVPQSLLGRSCPRVAARKFGNAEPERRLQ